MNVKQIIKLAAIYLQLDDVLKMSILGGEDEEPSETTQKNLALLLQAVNLVYEEIACDYLPLKYEQLVQVVNEEIAYSSLSKKIVQVISLKTSFNQNVKYRLYPNSIKVPNGIYQLEYTYVPDAVTIDEHLETFSGRLSERVVAYAVSSEYALIKGLFEEAITWKKRFEDSIKVAKSKKSLIKLARRGWF